MMRRLSTSLLTIVALVLGREYRLPCAVAPPVNASCARSDNEWAGAVCRAPPRDAVHALCLGSAAPEPGRVK
jgi:hypothetical protein